MATERLRKLDAAYQRVCEDLPVATVTQINTELGIGHTTSEAAKICRDLIERYYVHRPAKQR
jgi:hypothetical protein